jgi:hypothetical protein
MRFSRITKFVLILALAALVLPLSTNLAPRVHAYPPYSLTSVPASTAEGNTVGLYRKITRRYLDSTRLAGKSTIQVLGSKDRTRSWASTM